MRTFEELQISLNESKDEPEMLEIIAEELEQNQEELEYIEEDSIDSLVQQDKYDSCEVKPQKTLKFHPI